MKLLLSIQLLFFITNTINGDANPKVNPKQAIAEQTSEPQPEWQNIPMSRLSGPKTIVISAQNGDLNDDQNVMQAVMNAISIERDLKSDSVESKETIPEIVMDQKQPEHPMGGQPTVQNQKPIKLPTIARMISSEEQQTDSKKNPLWRSPIPFIHPDDCPHRHRRAKALRKKNRKTLKKTTVTDTTVTTTGKPIEESDSGAKQFQKLLMKAMSPPEVESEPMAQPSNELRPRSFMMAFRRKTVPEPDVPISTEPKRPMFVALIRKRFVPKPEPNSLSELLTQPESQPLSSSLPFNPFMSLLSRIIGQPEPTVDLKSSRNTSDDRKREINNFHFNINLTINNNYVKSEDKTPLQLLSNLNLIPNLY